MSRGTKVTGKAALAREDIAALRTIGEVAEHLDLPQHVLRFWETRFVEIEPVKRAGGRRLYRPRDIELVEAIRHLLYREGYTIKGVQRILKEQGVDSVIAEVTGRRQEEPPPPAPEPEPAAPRPHSPQPAFEQQLTQASLDLPVPDPPRIYPQAASTEAAHLAPPEPEPPVDFAPAVERYPRPNLPTAPMFRSPPTIDGAATTTRRLNSEEARLLREALEEIEECKRLLGLTRR
jgi:DNA-binding transcriptional MerR regulator